MKDINIYECKDGRARAYIKETKKVVSYPRLLLEEKLGRSLQKDEQVHHSDGNPLNNDISNLEVMRLGEHQQHHSQPKYFDKMVICSWCGKEFLWSAKQQSAHNRNINRKERQNHDREKIFCSKSCIGKYARHQQLNNR